MTNATYWNRNGIHQKHVDALEALIPDSGAVENPRKNRALEKFRKAANCYYDLYNNGLYNRASEFRQVFGISSRRYKKRNDRFSDEMFVAVEREMDTIIANAVAEQGIAG